jgi:hypothetical protein
MYSPQTNKWFGLLAVLDTTLEVNCISKAVVDRLGFRPVRAAPSCYELADGQQLLSNLTVSCTWSLNTSSRSNETQFHVINHATFDVLFNFDTIKDAGMLRAQSLRLDITYRVRGIPMGYDKSKTQKLLEKIIFTGRAASTVAVKCLATDPGEKEQTATINLENIEKIPDSLSVAYSESGEGTEWRFEARDLKRPLDAFESGEDNALSTFRITIDNHFKGITTLRSFKDPSEHKIE